MSLCRLSHSFAFRAVADGGRGRAVSVSSSSGTTVVSYDFEGRAVGISGPGVSRTFLRDGAYVTDPVLKDGAAVYPPGISERRGTTTTFLHGGLKNVDAQSRPTQALSATRTYDAFGNVASSSGMWRGPFGYGGGYGYQEDATGLRLLGHRFYDPSIGRFLTRDPVKDGRNWYVYCDNDPVNGADPTGLIVPVLVVIGAGALIGGIVGAITNPDNRLGGAGRGALIGGVAAGVGFVASVGAAAGAGAIGVGGWVGGAGSGAVGGFTGSLASQALADGLGWQNGIDWWNVGAGTLTGGLGGGAFIRPVPNVGPVSVTHWGYASPWVQVGGDDAWNWTLAGRPKGAPVRSVVDGSELHWPGGMEWGKGLLGQRIYSPTK